MKKKQRMHYYGVLATYNPYDDTWYSFYKDDMMKYFSTQTGAVSNYGKGKETVCLQ